MLKWLIIVKRGLLRYVNVSGVLPEWHVVLIFAGAMKHGLIFIVILSALCLGSCRSHRQVATARPSVSHPGRPQDQRRPVLPPVTGASDDSNDAELVGRIIDGAYGWVGTPYAYGGTTRKGVDCSGFVQRLFADIAAVSLPRNTRKQAEYCRPVKRELLQPGDLVFFNGSRIGGGIGHVGLYLGDDRMIHASSSRGVIVSAITERYYTQRYCGGGRVDAITYAARGAKPGHRKPSAAELPVAVNVPAPSPTAPEPAKRSALPAVEVVGEASVEDGDIVVLNDISAKVDSAFAVARIAEEPDTVCSSWMD